MSPIENHPGPVQTGPTLDGVRRSVLTEQPDYLSGFVDETCEKHPDEPRLTYEVGDDPKPPCLYCERDEARRLMAVDFDRARAAEDEGARLLDDLRVAARAMDDKRAELNAVRDERDALFADLDAARAEVAGLTDALSAQERHTKARNRARRKDRLAVDADGYGWRVSGDMWSMIRTTTTNDPIPQPVTYFVPEANVDTWCRLFHRAKDERDEWRGAAIAAADSANAESDRADAAGRFADGVKAERDALAAKVEAVRALADDLATRDRLFDTIAADLRRALDTQ